MVLSNALILWTGMWYNNFANLMTKSFRITLYVFSFSSRLTYCLLLLLLFCASCRGVDSIGFYQPVTMSLTAPQGPPEYTAGWYAGCKTSLALGTTFANSFVHGEGEGATYGSGIYQHEPAFQTGWSQGYFSCVLHNWGFVNYHSMKHGPLQ